MITREELKEVLHYNPSTGIFTRLTTYHKSRNGKTVGSVDTGGYLYVTRHNKTYRLHRLAWLYMTGEHPTQDIDHINNNKKDNSWKNLRQATVSQNIANQPLHTRNGTHSTGVKGIHWSRVNQNYSSCIVKEGKRHRKLFTVRVHKDKKSALKAAITWIHIKRKELYGDFAHHG